MPGRNVFTALRETTEKYRDMPALHQPVGGKAKGEYKTYSWNDLRRISQEIAAGLHVLGLEKSEIVCILSETRAEFYLVDLGIMGAGGVAAALYTAYPIPDLVVNLEQARPRFLFIENRNTLEALTAAVRARGNEMPEHVVVMVGGDPGLFGLEKLLELGRTAQERDPTLFERIQADISP